MPIIDILDEPALEQPAMILALRGWVDAGSVGTGAAELIAEGGETVAEADPDALFDYRSNRPVLTFQDGRLQQVAWPWIDIKSVSRDGRDLLVVSGHEPDFRWRELALDLAGVASRFGVTDLVTLGGVPAAVPHTLPPPILTTADDPDLLGPDENLLSGSLVVPGAAVNIVARAVADADVRSVGFWAQVPHYLGDTYHAGIVALAHRAMRHLGFSMDLTDAITRSADQRDELDAMVAERPEAKAYLERLEQLVGDGMPTADEIGAEVERFLRDQAAGGEHPFRD